MKLTHHLRTVVAAGAALVVLSATTPAHAAQNLRGPKGVYGWVTQTPCATALGARAFIQETGKGGINLFKVLFRRDYLGMDHKWHQDRQFDLQSDRFSDDAISYKWDPLHDFPWTAGDLGTYRLRIIYEWWHARSAPWWDQKKSSRTLLYPPCTPSDWGTGDT